MLHQPGQRIRALLRRREPATISGSNTVFRRKSPTRRSSTRAKGYIDEAQNMGWLQRFFLNRAAVLIMSTIRSPDSSPSRLAALACRLRCCRDAGSRRAPEGPRQHSGRARQPADRLRPRGRPRRHRRPDDADAVHDAEPDQHARAARHHAAAASTQNMQLKNVAAVMVTAHAAAVRAAGPSDRRDGFVARQCEEPARRHAADDAAEGRRRPGLRDGAGQPRGRRRGRAARTAARCR